MRVIYLGTPGAFSVTPLRALLAAGIEVCAVVVPAPAHARLPAPIVRVTPDQHTPLLFPDLHRALNIVRMACEEGITVFAAARLDDPATVATLAGLRPDALCAAGFPWRVPAALLALPPLGVLNVHPSLLPAHRGPAPLFWTFRDGERSTGVTIHFMDEGFDTGDIAAQAPINLPDGISGAQASRVCAALGARLLVETLHALRDGSLARRKQPPGGSYETWPTPDDFTLSTAWPARRAFNFMCGTAHWQRPYPVVAAGERLLLATATSYAAEATVDAPFVRWGDEVRVQFTPGIVQAHTYQSPAPEDLVHTG